MTREQYESLALSDLKGIAKARGMRGTSTLKKAALIDAMLEQDRIDEEAKAAPAEAPATPVKDIADASFDKEEKLEPKSTVIINGPESVEIPMDLPSYQTSSQGCWSVAAQMMIASRGWKNLVTQEDIRGYRPKLEHNEDLEGNGTTDSDYNRDGGKNIMEMSDSILAFAPGSMMREFSVVPYDLDAEKAGLTPEQYINNAAKALKKQIIHALKEDKSPVALRLPGHYVTIIGIDGDTIKYKDSFDRSKSEHPFNETYTMSLKKLAKEEFMDKSFSQRYPIQLVWLSE